MSIRSLVFATLAAVASPAAAVPVQPLALIGYDMPNGSGVASGGAFNHWDRLYSGDGDTMVDGAPLTGGSGELADENVAFGAAFAVENLSGTGPWTGWAKSRTPLPEVALRLPVTADGRYLVVSSIDVHIDNSQIGGAFAPAAFRINGQLASFAAPAAGEIGWITLIPTQRVTTQATGTVLLQMIHAPEADWIFASELRVYGAAIPEPATWALLTLGFGLVGAALRQRGAHAIPAIRATG